LGDASADVASKPCYEILAGRDDRNRLICRKHCRAVETAIRGGVMSFDACVQTRASEPRWINMSTFTFQTHEFGPVLIHCFRDVTQRKRMEQFVGQVLTAAE
jgi:hypothetical protein